MRCPVASRSRVSQGALPPLIVNCGPTASGKTGLSLELSAHIPGAEIISADSRQVYREMDIGTAKVSRADRGRIPHHGMDLVEPDVPFSAYDYQRHAVRALESIAGRGGVALLVGGTGLYVRAVARGLPLEAAGHHPGARAELEARLANEGLEPLVAELRQRAPALASGTDLDNPRRVVRALERSQAVGDRRPDPPRGYAGPILWLGLSVEREMHLHWIEQRARAQFAGGLLEEAATLLETYPEDLRAFSAVGYREAFDLLSARCDLETAVQRTIVRTRSYARRQRTWFRAERDVEWLDAGDSAVAHKALELSQRFLA
jgi:tRNA dimethylallyltransferase